MYIYSMPIITLEYPPGDYITEALKEYSFTDINTQETPMQSNFYDELRLHQNDPIMCTSQYRNMVGTLQFLANRTRPDIATAVAILSEFSAVRNTFLLNAVKRVFAYLSGTKYYGLKYRSNSQHIDLKFYCDSDYAGDTVDRKSRTGWLGMVNNCIFSWSSRKQTTLSTSTAEAEYYAMNDCANEAKRIR